MRRSRFDLPAPRRLTTRGLVDFAHLRTTQAMNQAAPNRDGSGYFCLVLHAHLPFVRHPEHRYMLEENWLYEALTETYLPLIDIFEMLREDGVPFRLTMSLTPPLCAMLSDPLLRERYAAHLDRLIELAGKEI